MLTTTSPCIRARTQSIRAVATVSVVLGFTRDAEGSELDSAHTSHFSVFNRRFRGSVRVRAPPRSYVQFAQSLLRSYVHFAEIICALRREHMYSSPRAHVQFAEIVLHFAEIICTLRRDHMYNLPRRHEPNHRQGIRRAAPAALAFAVEI